MYILGGSPFQPDAASDWWNFGVSTAIALLTLFALVISLRAARASERSAALARDEAALSRKAATEAGEREHRFRVETEEAARTLERNEFAIRWAERQALDVHMEVYFTDFKSGSDLRREMHWRVENISRGPLRDVTIYPGVGLTNVDNIPSLPPRPFTTCLLIPGTAMDPTAFPSREASGTGIVDLYEVDEPASLRIVFTDMFGHVWQSETSGDLKLVRARPISFDPSAATPERTR